MDERFLFLAILLPIIGGILTPVIGKRSQKVLYGWVFAVSIATSLLTWALILTCKTDSYTIVRLTDVLTLTLRFDGRVDVLMAWDADFDYKLECLLAVVDTKLEANEKGTIDLKRKEIRFIPG